MKYVVEIELDENRSTCIDCPLCNCDDYCTLLDVDEAHMCDSWGDQLLKCKLVPLKANSLTELKAKAEKWDMIQWAVDEFIQFVENDDGTRNIHINNDDLDRLEEIYKEREQVE